MKLNCWKGRFIAVRIKKTILHLALFVVLELKFSAERRGIIRIRYLTLWVWLGLVAYVSLFLQFDSIKFFPQ